MISPTLPHPFRKTTYAQRGMVATSQPLAAQAGLAILQRGGNAVDAALATAITLTVVEPTSNGVAGDAFALVWDGNALQGINGSGRAPMAQSLERLTQRGLTEISARGWESVTVPGAPATWRDLHARYGRLPFSSLFETAIYYAESGFPLSPTVHHYWNLAVTHTAPTLKGDEFSGFLPLFAPNGRAPQSGEVWRNPAQARLLQRIAESNAADFYTGESAQAIADFAAKTGGVMTLADLAAHTNTWVTPIHTDYRGYQVYEIPPNGQGLAALIALNILEGYDFSTIPYDSPERYHLQIEAMKLATMDAWRYIADPDHVSVPTHELLSKPYAAERRKLITERASLPTHGNPARGGTVYLSTADQDGMMVSYIQSNYTGFGSYVTIPGLGIGLHSRGMGFSLDPTHPNRLAPGKRPFHTIIPGFLMQNGRPIGPFGVMGGPIQPQGHVQVVMNTIDYGFDPQFCLDSPRWFWEKGLALRIEDEARAVALAEQGHAVTVDRELGTFGRGQIIWRSKSGVYSGGTESRADGCAIGY
jgi:gamma-glutamyltranspeptidase/glutathione hydrolase